MKIIAMIPARAGSKGVPGKNFKSLNGRPLIAYSVDFALTCPEISHVVINSDDQRILEEYESANERLQIYKRRTALGRDETPMIEVLLDYLEQTSHTDGWMLLLQPTSPFRSYDDFKRILSVAKQSPSIHCVTSVSKVPKEWSPSLMFTKTGSRLNWLSSDLPTRRQDCPDHYIRNGQFYLFSIASLLEKRAIIAGEVHAVESDIAGVNIDSEQDWQRALQYATS